MLKRTAFTLLTLLLLAAVPASAAVYFCPSGCNPWFPSINGTSYQYGFVGKGDVQLAFGFNNKAMQSNYANVYFTYGDEAKAKITCSHETGRGTKYNTFKRKFGVAAITEFDRKGPKGQLTGYGLIGLTGDGDAFDESTACADFKGDNGNDDGPWTFVSVEWVEGSQTNQTLDVHYGEITVPLQYLPWPVPIEP